ncbi:MAG: hypothetical protein LBD88_01935 [Candidatus Peribacteria bacterium]|nr:hypothetical protein [Candidatus Peribacteria bacterium]
MTQNKDNEAYLQYAEKYKELREKLNKEYSKVSSTNKIDKTLSIPRIMM